MFSPPPPTCVFPPKVYLSSLLLIIVFYFGIWPGRLEDSLLGGGSGSSKRNADTLGLGSGKRSGIMWNNFSGHHAFTTGRQRSNEPAMPFMGAGGGGGVMGGVGASKSGRPKGPSQTLKVGAWKEIN